MKAIVLRTVGVLAIVCVAGCGARPPRDANAEELARASAARTVNETAIRVAVSKTGQKICRQLTVGIAERDWIHGVVLAVEGERIRVRIDDPGRFPQTLNGVTLAKGAVVTDTPLNWTPCL